MLRPFYVSIRDVIRSVNDKVRRVNDKSTARDSLNESIRAVGEARIGKDALVMYVAGINLKAEEGEYGGWRLSPVNEPDPETCDLKIVDGLSGSTSLGFCQMADGPVFCSCPGGYGIEGAVQDIDNTTSIEKLFTPDLTFKLMLTVPYSSLERENGIKHLAECLAGFMRTYGAAAMGAAILVFTKVPPRDSGIDTEGKLLKRLEETVVDALKRFPKHCEAPALLKHLLALDRVCIFPAPAGPGPYPEEYRDAIRRRLNSFPHFNPATSRWEVGKVPLTPETKEDQAPRRPCKRRDLISQDHPWAGYHRAR